MNKEAIKKNETKNREEIKIVDLLEKEGTPEQEENLRGEAIFTHQLL